jgi:hypothetical protein
LRQNPFLQFFRCLAGVEGAKDGRDDCDAGCAGFHDFCRVPGIDPADSDDGDADLPSNPAPTTTGRSPSNAVKRETLPADKVRLNVSPRSSDVSYFPDVRFLPLGFFGPCFGFFHASAATCLVKKAHDSQDRGQDNDHPFRPRGRPPNHGQNNNGCGHQKPAETELHDSTSFFLELGS